MLEYVCPQFHGYRKLRNIPKFRLSEPTYNNVSSYIGET